MFVTRAAMGNLFSKGQLLKLVGLFLCDVMPEQEAINTDPKKYMLF